MAPVADTDEAHWVLVDIAVVSQQHGRLKGQRRLFPTSELVSIGRRWLQPRQNIHHHHALAVPLAVIRQGVGELQLARDARRWRELDRGAGIAIDWLNQRGAGGDASDRSREPDAELALLVDRHGAAELAAGGVKGQPGRQRRSVVQGCRPDRTADSCQRRRWSDADPARIQH